MVHTFEILNYNFRWEISSIYYRNWLGIGIPFYLLGGYFKLAGRIETGVSVERILLILYVGMFCVETIIFKNCLELYLSSTILCFIIFINMQRNSSIKKNNTSSFIMLIGQKYSKWVYIVHYAVIFLLRDAFEKSIVLDWIMPVLVFCVSCLLSIVLYYLENNMRQWYLKAKRL